MDGGIKWPERLVVVRHGQSEQNVAFDLFDECLEAKLDELRQVKDADIALTETGIWQAEQTGLYLAETQQFDICLSSPYRRTLQTADNIVENLQYPLRIFKDNRLREKEFGRLHSLSKTQIKEKYPDEVESRERDGKYWYRLPGGENYPDVEMRIHSILDKLSRDWAGKSVLVVTHHVPCLLFRGLFEHLGEEEILALGDVSNCGMNAYRLDTSTYPEGRMKLSQWNAVAYEQSFS